MARNKYSIKREEGKEKFLKEAVALFGDNPEPLRELVENACQNILEAEITGHLEAEPYQRSDNRKGYRNGYKPRTIKTRIGKMNFQVPQSRDGSFSTELFARYQRSEKALSLALMETVIQGVSTRRIKKITETLCGTDFSAGLVSSLSKTMDEELERFRNRDLSATTYPYLIIDARYEKIRVAGQVVNQAVLIIVGVNEAGYREVLSEEIANLESESTWGEIFKRLKGRGLKGVKLVVSDNHQGLKNALFRHFSGCLWQRCQVHFIRNLLGLVSRKEQKQLIKSLHHIWEAENLKEAQSKIRQVVAFYEEKYPEVANKIEAEAEETLAVLSLPEKHRPRLATTNSLERLSQTIKQRTRVVRIFPNRESCLRLVTALLQETHEDWITGHKYLNMSKNEETDASSAQVDFLLNLNNNPEKVKEPVLLTT